MLAHMLISLLSYLFVYVICLFCSSFIVMVVHTLDLQTETQCEFAELKKS